MSDEQRADAQQAPGIATETAAAAAGPPMPKWGDPLSSISQERQMTLRALADQQRAWVEATPHEGQRDLGQSAFKEVPLTGAEAFYLAAYALASPGADEVALEASAARLRAAIRHEPNT